MFSLSNAQRKKYETFIMCVGYWAMLFLAIFVPLAFDTEHLSVVATPKTLLIITAALIFVGLVSIRAFLRRTVTLSFSYLQLAVLFFLGVLTVSALYGVDPYNSFFGSAERSTGLILIYASAALAFVFPIFVDTDTKRRHVLQAFFLGTVLLAVSTYLDRSGVFTDGLFRYALGGGTMGNTSFAGGYMLFGLFIAVYLVITTSSQQLRMIYAGGILGVLFSPIFFQVNVFRALTTEQAPWMSRLMGIVDAQAAFLGIIVGALLAGALYLLICHTKIHRRVGLILLACLTGLVIFSSFSFFASDGYLHERYVELKSENRFVFWDIAFRGFTDRPLFGWGPQNYQYVYEQHFNPRILEAGHLREFWVSNPHNIFFEYLATLGILGFVGYLVVLVLLGVMFFRLRKHQDQQVRTLYYILPGLLVGLVVYNFFTFDSPASVYAFFLIVGLAFSIDSSSLWRRTISLSSPRAEIISTISVLGVLALCVFLFIIAVVYPARVSYQLSSIVSEGALTARDTRWDTFMDIKARGGLIDAGHVSDGIYDQLLRAIPSIGHNNERRALLVGEIDNVLAYVEDREAQTGTHHYRSSYYAVKLLGLRQYLMPDRSPAFRERMNGHLNNVIATGPTNPQTYFAAAQVRADEGDVAATIEYLKKGLTLAPGNQEAYGLIQSFLATHDSPELRAFTEETYQNYVHTQGEQR